MTEEEFVKHQLSVEKMALMWIKCHLQPAKTYSHTGLNHSYVLKHEFERDTSCEGDNYLGAGEFAALMFFCGFEGRRCRNDYVKDPRHMNYEFKCKKIKR